MAAELPFLYDGLATVGAASLGYLLLIAVIALTAVFSSRPTRRKAAFDVLRLLLPGRRRLRSQPPGHDTPGPPVP